ncbi:TPA: hypothetical protein I9Z34_003054 [Clostridium perfringens]|nr:hypothetical protein [Clostridium perfringens]
MGGMLLEVGTSSVVSAMQTAFTNIQNDCMSTVSSGLPVALTIAGVGIVVTFGVKFFKRFAK